MIAIALFVCLRYKTKKDESFSTPTTASVYASEPLPPPVSAGAVTTNLNETQEMVCVITTHFTFTTVTQGMVCVITTNFTFTTVPFD